MDRRTARRLLPAVMAVAVVIALFTHAWMIVAAAAILSGVGYSALAGGEPGEDRSERRARRAARRA